MLHQYQDVFKSLSAHNVKYVVIGGLAAILYGVPQVTFGLDILIEATQTNAERLLDAFMEAGLGSASLTTPEKVLAHEITVFNDKVRIDVQTQTPGLDFETAWRNYIAIVYQDREILFVTKHDLIAACSLM